jgi:hypothetical protein
MLQPTIDEKIQLVPKAQLGSWGKGSSGGAKASETGMCGVALWPKLLSHGIDDFRPVMLNIYWWSTLT